MRTHKSEVRWRSRIRAMQANLYECSYILIGKAKNNDAVNALVVVVNRIGHKTKHDEKKCRK
jgi:hypothetical protein